MNKMHAISRGTTPTIQWRLDRDVTGWTDVVISIGEENEPVWECTDPRVSSVDNGSVIECVMSQEETLALKPGPTHIQLRAADDTRAGVTDMVGIYVRGVINEDNLGAQTLEPSGEPLGRGISIDPGIIEIHACLHIGVKGDDGYTPRKGIDYWTPQDVAEIDAAKLAATDAACAAASAARAAISAEGAATTAANHATAVADGIKLAAESGEFDGKDADIAAANAATSAANAAASNANSAASGVDAAKTEAQAAASEARTAATNANNAASSLSGEIAESRAATARANTAAANADAAVAAIPDTIAQRVQPLEQRVAWLENVETKADLSWEQISEIVQAGRGAEYLPIGTQIEVPWMDVGANQRHVFLFDVMHHYDGSDADHPLVECEDGTTRRGVCLQMHRTIPFGVVWSPKQAFYCTEGGLAAGTYCFDVEVVTMWGSTGEWATKGTRTYRFTLGSAVPAGGQLVFSGDPYTAKLPTMSVQAFTAFGTTAAQTVAISEGAGGTNLGTITTSCHDGFNAYPRATYGNNAWRESSEREWLNTSAAKSAWNTQKAPWERPHALATTKAGFLAGFENDFLGALASCRHMTETHAGDPAGGAVVETFDRFFFPSAREHYFTNYLSITAAGYAAEGVPWDYWKQLAEANGKTSPWSGWETFPELITYDNTAWPTARTVWLRSAYRYVTHSSLVGYVNPSGYVSSTSAHSGYCAAPACIIC